jgi:hypothetical protein
MERKPPTTLNNVNPALKTWPWQWVPREFRTNSDQRREKHKDTTEEASLCPLLPLVTRQGRLLRQGAEIFHEPAGRSVAT